VATCLSPTEEGKAAANSAAHGREEGGRADPSAASDESGIVDPSHSAVTYGDVHLHPLLQQLSELSDEEKAQAVGLIKQYGDVFSEHEFDLGCTPLLQHHIDTGNARPIRQGLLRHPQVYLNVIDERVESMLQAGIIEPSSSPWASNVVLVKKADASTPPRVTIDYRLLNLVMYKDSYQIPNIGACLDALEGCKYFSTLHLSSVFFQVPLHQPTLIRPLLSLVEVCSSFVS